MNRNKPCYCGSKKKYKVCHLYLDQGWIKEIPIEGQRDRYFYPEPRLTIEGMKRVMEREYGK